MRTPIVAEPADGFGDRVLVFDIFLERVRVVETQMADAAVFGGEPEIQDDRLRVPEVQIAIRLRGKSRDDASTVFPAAVVLGDDRAEKVRRHRFTHSLRGAALVFCRHRCERKCTRARMWRCSIHRGLFMNKIRSDPFYAQGGVHRLRGLRRRMGRSSENRATQRSPRIRRCSRDDVVHNSCGWRCAYLVNSSAKSRSSR